MRSWKLPDGTWISDTATSDDLEDAVQQAQAESAEWDATAIELEEAAQAAADREGDE